MCTCSSTDRSRQNRDPRGYRRHAVPRAQLTVGLALTLLVGAADRSLALTNGQFDTVYQADANGNCLYSGGNPVCGTLTPGSYTDGLGPVQVLSTPPKNDIPTLGLGSQVSCGGTVYSNATSESAPVNLYVPGWVQSIPGHEGVQVASPGMFTTPQTTFLYVNGPGFGGPSGGVLVYQDLGPAATVLAPHSLYTLNVDVGARGDPAGGPLAIPIVAGLFYGAPTVAYNVADGSTDWTLAAELAAFGYQSTNTPTTGEFVTWSKTYQTGATLPSGDVYLVLGTLNDAPVTGDQADFTNVKFAATQVPEPATTGLVFLAGAALLAYSFSRRHTAVS